jgi:BMFP domain-containing protein YqiC
MTQTSNRLMDEFAKLMTDAAGVAQGVRREIETAVRSQMERFLGDMDIVQREQFEAVREMAARARDDNEELRGRVAELESRIAALEGGSAPQAGGAAGGGGGAGNR